MLRGRGSGAICSPGELRRPLAVTCGPALSAPLLGTALQADDRPHQLTRLVDEKRVRTLLRRGRNREVWRIRALVRSARPPNTWTESMMASRDDCRSRRM